MVINPKKSPYRGLWVFIPMMILPPVVLTWIFYLVISMHQGHLGSEMNWASAKIFGCGLGILYHISCWLVGAFKEDFRAVKKRMKEFFSNLTVSLRLAFRWYWEDVRELGVAFWIDFAIVALNAGFFVDAVLDFLALYGA